MNRYKVSVIIPVFNAGTYLRDCLDSLINQTLNDMEFILVLDCPTDGSESVCREYEAKDQRIKLVVNEKNLHIGCSRNRGLEIAQGEYIGFSDHDDYRELYMYEKLYHRAKKNKSDVVLGVTVNDENGQRRVFDYPLIEEKAIGEFAVRDLIGCGNNRDDIPLAVNVHSNLYKRELLLRNQIKFVDTKKIVPEDRLFNLECLLYAKRTDLERTPLYYHRILEHSEGHQASYFDPTKRLAYVDKSFHILSTGNFLLQYENEFNVGAAKYLCNILLGTLLSKKTILVFPMILSEIKSRPYTKQVFNHIEIKNDKTWIKLIKILLSTYLR
jgi:glycosyltransferase involved in cell wall biosynthesis